MIKLAIMPFAPKDVVANFDPLITPYLRHGPFFGRFPGNKLPGYDLSIPTGHLLLTPVHLFNRKNSALPR